MNLQDQWTNLYTEVFKLHKEMTQDGSLFPDNKAKLPLSVRIKCFFRIIKVKKYSNYVDKFSKKIIESLHYVKCTLAALYKGNVSFREDEFAEFLYKDDSEQFERYKRFRDQQVDLYRERLEKEQTVLQTNIVDLCAVLDTLNIIKGALSLGVDEKATDEIHKIVDREIAELEKYDGTNVQKIIADICRAKTFDLAWKMYERHQNLLKEFTIVKYNDGKDPSWKAIDLFKPFSHIEESKRHIYSIFYKGQVNCISRNALMRGKNLITSERNVGFDNNVARYLKSFSAGQKIDVDISGIIKFMTTTQGVHFGYLPYMVENLLSDNYEADGLLENIFYIERLYYSFSKNKKTKQFCLDAAKKQISAIDNDYMLNLFSGWYKKVYVRVLVIAYVYLKSPKSPKRQFENLCRTFRDELNDYAIPELSMAYDFYYNKVLVSFGKTKEYPYVVSSSTAKLDLLMKNQSLRTFFERKGWATTFDYNDFILSPPLFNNIYKGALGEMAGRFLLWSCLGLNLTEIVDPEVFELFDYKIENTDIFIDFKNWHERTRFSNEEMLKKIKSKADTCNAKCIIVINVVSEQFSEPIKASLGDVTVVQIPSLIDPNNPNQPIHKAFDMIKRCINEFSD